MKKLELSTKDTKTLVELLDRGLAYTDDHYSSRNYDKMEKVWNKVIEQLKEQGATSVFNGEIKFK